MKRFRFIIKRLLSMIVIMFVVSFLVFVVLRMSDAAISGLMLVLSGAPSFLVSILILIFMTKYVPGYSFIGTYTNFGEFLQRIMIPSLIMALTFVAMLGRITRSNMINQLQSPYIATAAAKGLKQSNITYKHAFHNAVIPVITVAGYMIAGSIGSTVIVEQVFSLPGIGGLLISAIEENNFPIVQILVLFMLGAYLVMSFVIDILYTVLDPRVDLK